MSDNLCIPDYWRWERGYKVNDDQAPSQGEPVSNILWFFFEWCSWLHGVIVLGGTVSAYSNLDHGKYYVALVVVGRQSSKRMLVGFQATPTFRFYQNGECVNITTGVNENNLRSAVEQYRAKWQAGHGRDILDVGCGCTAILQLSPWCIIWICLDMDKRCSSFCVKF